MTYAVSEINSFHQCPGMLLSTLQLLSTRAAEPCLSPAIPSAAALASFFKMNPLSFSLRNMHLHLTPHPPPKATPNSVSCSTRHQFFSKTYSYYVAWFAKTFTVSQAGFEPIEVQLPLAGLSGPTEAYDSLEVTLLSTQEFSQRT